MPAVKFTMEELRGLSGIHDVEDDALIDAISMIGADYQGSYDGVLEFEFFPDRPDLFSVEGVARALRHYLGGEVRHHPVSRGDIVMTADPTVRDVRPYVVGGVVRGVSLDGDAVLSLMSLQEKLHATIGRDRRKVAIGVHDLDRVVPPFTYTAIAPDSLSFVPLGHTEPMTPEEILRRHEKGLAYAHILEGVDRCPMILDSNGDVLSFPPVINGALTTVTTETRNVFIDCTGTSLGALRTALNIVATSLAERGGSIESIEVAPSGDYRWFEPMVLPDLEPRPLEVGHGYIEETIGQEMSDEEVLAALARMGFAAEYAGRVVLVTPPPYRGDILHPIDIVEDVAIGHGYGAIRMSLPRVATMGAELPWWPVVRAFRATMVGLGFLEVVSLDLQSPDEEFTMMRRPAADVPHISNPIGRETSILRSSMIPPLLRLLSDNRHRSLPQRVFEVGSVFRGGEQRRMAGWAVIEALAGFTAAKSTTEAIFRDLDSPLSIVPADDPAFIPGRQAWIHRNGDRIGVFGEIHPEVLVNFELGHPVIAGEFLLDVFQ